MKLGCMRREKGGRGPSMWCATKGEGGGRRKKETESVGGGRIYANSR